MAINRDRKDYKIGKVSLGNRLFFTLHFNGVMYFLHVGTIGDRDCSGFSFDSTKPSLFEAVEEVISHVDNESGERLWSWFLEFNEKMSVIESDEYYISMRSRI